MIISKCEYFDESRGFGSLLIWSVQMCVNMMPRGKDISSDLRKAIVAVSQLGKRYKAIAVQFEIHHSTAKNIISKWKSFKTAANHPRT